MAKLSNFKILFMLVFSVQGGFLYTNNYAHNYTHNKNTLKENNTIMDFAESFITSYDLSKRDTHEYTPYILNKTKDSFLELEAAVQKAGFKTDGHIALLGYQEEAVPPYTTNWARHGLEDEVSVQTAQGIAEPTKNIFGFATGFLLKDSEWLSKRWSPGKKSAIKHVYAQKLDIFDDDAIIFQKHALGKDFNIIMQHRDRVEKSIYSNNLKEVLQSLYNFWLFMYKESSQSGSQEIMATQDMLFSIDYARGLLKSLLPINTLFVGPDITYPIEVLSCQKQEVTAHAQKFIQKFQKELIAVDDKKTAYIFCSFVDGVGKSTLLNNIYNWSNHGSNFSSYERCDNSSSQEAAFFDFNEKVVIVDLPAQVSHYVFKPDGYVYVDIQTVKNIQQQEVALIHEFLNTHATTIGSQYDMMCKSVIENAQDLYSIENPEYCYIQNLFVINKLKEVQWIPFRYKENHYLFNIEEPEKIRILVPLAEAHSFGLKVVEPAQMLFLKGLSLPMSYTLFLDNLMLKLNKAGIEHVRFVNFLSMYPRSSRENIRLNFVLQYLRKIFDESYDINKGFYKHKLYQEQEVCSLLVNNLDSAVESLYSETLIRMALYELLYGSFKDSVHVEPAKNLETLLVHKLEVLKEKYGAQIKHLIQERLTAEQKSYRKKYELDRLYQTLVQFSSTLLVKYSELIDRLFSNHINNNYIKSLWSGFNSKFDMLKAALTGASTLENGTKVAMLYSFNKKARSENELKESFRFLRSQWYALLSQLLSAQKEETNYVIDTVSEFIAPLSVKVNKDTLCIVQKQLEELDPEQKEVNVDIAQLIKYNIDPYNKKASFGIFDNNYHRLSGDPVDTYTGLFAYGYFPDTYIPNSITYVVETYLENQAQKNKPLTLSTSTLYKKLMDPMIVESLKKDIAASLGKKRANIIKFDDSCRSGIQLWVRMVATLDLIIKDPESVILLRKNNKEDFVAALKLLEQVTLPIYYNIQLEGPLFDDYYSVMPAV